VVQRPDGRSDHETQASQTSDVRAGQDRFASSSADRRPRLSGLHQNCVRAKIARRIRSRIKEEKRITPKPDRESPRVSRNRCRYYTAGAQRIAAYRTEHQWAARGDRCADHTPSRLRGEPAEKETHRGAVRLGQDDRRSCATNASWRQKAWIQVYPDDGQLQPDPLAKTRRGGSMIPHRSQPSERRRGADYCSRSPVEPLQQTAHHSFDTNFSSLLGRRRARSVLARSATHRRTFRRERFAARNSWLTFSFIMSQLFASVARCRSPVRAAEGAPEGQRLE
jgi:hypothetical protein